MTSRPDTAADIEAEALAWAVRFPLDAEQTQALEAWYAGDRRRRGALTRALAAWTLLDRARAVRRPDGAPTTWNEDPPDAAGAPRRGSARWVNRRLLMGAIGGGIAASVGGIAVLPLFRKGYETTALGEIRRLPLADGSLATINTDSALHIALSQRLRRIDLVRGEAWFEVAKDRNRPFVVDAGGVRVRAVGTAFSVRRIHGSVLVSVTEGIVSAWSDRRASNKVALNAGDQARFDDNGLVGSVDRAPARIERSLAWRDGEIALEGDTLAYAISEYNRYNSTKLELADPALGNERLVGLYDTNDPAGFADIVGQTLGVTVTRESGVIILSRGPVREKS